MSNQHSTDSRSPHRLTLSFKRLCRFGAVGVFGTSIYFVTVELLHEDLHLGLASAGAFAFSLVAVINYSLHYFWTFESTRRHTMAAPRFLAMALAGLALNYLGVTSGIHWLKLQKWLAVVLGAVLVIAWNLLGSVLWVFVEHYRRLEKADSIT